MSYETSVCLNHLTVLSDREESVESKRCHVTGNPAEVELHNEDRYPAVDLRDTARTFYLTELPTRNRISWDADSRAVTMELDS
jgi:hypothetical protein